MGGQGSMKGSQRGQGVLAGRGPERDSEFVKQRNTRSLLWNRKVGCSRRPYKFFEKFNSEKKSTDNL